MSNLHIPNLFAIPLSTLNLNISVFTALEAFGVQPRLSFKKIFHRQWKLIVIPEDFAYYME